MANSTEKKNEKLEKQNKKLKKKNKAGGKVILFLLLIIAILAAIMFFLDPFGWGIGPNGAGTGTQSAASEDAAAPSAPEAVEGTEETEAPPLYIDITVSGSTYILGSDESDIESIISRIEKDTGEYDGTVIVRISDNSATQNAMEALLNALDDSGAEYIMEQ